MIGLEQFRKKIMQQLEVDRLKKSIQVSGPTVQEALREASLELNIPINFLEYEVLVRGNKGFLKFSQKDWVLIAYESTKNVVAKNKDVKDHISHLDSASEVINIDEDGCVSVRLTSDGVMLKVFPPKGKGKPAVTEDVLELLRKRSVSNFNQDHIKNAIKHADAMSINIGQFNYNPANDGSMIIDISEDEMTASIKILPPRLMGADIMAEEIRSFLWNNSIEYGHLDDYINELEDFPVFKENLIVAKGLPPEHGKDAQIIYYFKTQFDKKKVHYSVDKQGRVNFSDLDVIQNVEADKLLAKKIQSTLGKDGRNIMGRYLPAKDGDDLDFKLGKNVTLSDDGNSVYAAKNGQVLLDDGKISVEDVTVIPYDVTKANTEGEVNILGSLIIQGNVEDGCHIKADGNIEIIGVVGNALVEAKGDIIIHRGVNMGEGQFDGKIVSENGNIFAMFIENANIFAGNFVIVSDGIVNSHVLAKGKILCKGRRAKLVGGTLKACEEINVTAIGGPGGVKTIVEVGYDPEIKEKMDGNVQKMHETQINFEKTSKRLRVLIRQKKLTKKLPPEKEEQLMFYSKQYQEEKNLIANLKSEIEQDTLYLDSVKQAGKISASQNAYPGVTVRIMDTEYEINSEFGATTFFLDVERDRIKTKKYEEITDDISYGGGDNVT